jgi:hypothetical protein
MKTQCDPLSPVSSLEQARTAHMAHSCPEVKVPPAQEVVQFEIESCCVDPEIRAGFGA